VKPGISGVMKPTFNLGIEALTLGTESEPNFQAIPYDFEVNPLDSIDTSDWKTTDLAGNTLTSLTITDKSITNFTTSCKVAVNSTTLTEFVLTNYVNIIRSGGKQIKLDRSLHVLIDLL
jgi:hypothetical protein